MADETMSDPDNATPSNDALIEAARRRWSTEDCYTSESLSNWTNARLALALAKRLEEMSNQ
jgi:hypothetical protein